MAPSPAQLRVLDDVEHSPYPVARESVGCSNELCLVTGSCARVVADCPYAGSFTGQLQVASVSIALEGYLRPAVEAPVAHTLGHAYWVRLCHWVAAGSCMILALTGFLILMVHPRLYWGEVGNDLTPALLTFPLSKNHRPSEMRPNITFANIPGRPVSAERNYRIFSRNGPSRSLHFLAAWLIVAVGAVYLTVGLVTSHFVRNLLPRMRELSPRAVWRDVKAHLRPRRRSVRPGPPYNLLQRLAYTGVLFVVLPLMITTGLTMSPAIANAFPFLLDFFGGHQSARTLHFFGFTLLLLFIIVHVGMVLVTGLRRQLRAMTWGVR
jgi:thiosulfate reductase cytochrome b subunit